MTESLFPAGPGDGRAARKRRSAGPCRIRWPSPEAARPSRARAAGHGGACRCLRRQPCGRQCGRRPAPSVPGRERRDHSGPAGRFRQVRPANPGSRGRKPRRRSAACATRRHCILRSGRDLDQAARAIDHRVKPELGHAGSRERRRRLRSRRANDAAVRHAASSGSRWNPAPQNRWGSIRRSPRVARHCR